MRFLFVPALLVVTTSWYRGAAAQEVAVRKQLQRRYDVAAAAFRRADVAALMAVTSPDLSSRRPDGQVWNRKQLQVYMNLAIGALKKIESATFRVGKVKIHGDEAVALVDHRVAGILNGGAKPRKIVDVSTDRDTWVRAHDTWLLKFTECVRERVTIDGKVVQPDAALAAPRSSAR